MQDRGEWLQIILILIFVGLGVVQWVVKQFWSKSGPPGAPGTRPEQPRSPAIQLLEKLRAESERAATTDGSQARAGGPPLHAGDSQVPGAVLDDPRRRERNEKPAGELVYDEGSDDEDAFFGDDHLAGQRAIREDSTRDRAQRSSTRERSPRGGPEDAQKDFSDRRAGRQPRTPPREARSPSTPRHERVLRATQTRAPKEQVIHPRTEHVQHGVQDPRAEDEHIQVYADLDLDDTASDLGVSRLPEATAAPRRAQVAGLFDAAGMDLRRAMIGQIVLGPPKSLEGRRRPYREI